jgi:hypothetical protein
MGVASSCGESLTWLTLRDMKKVICAVICGVLVSYGVLGAEPVSMLGLKLQQPLSLHECKFNRDVYVPGMPRERHYLADITVPCFKREHDADIGTKKPIKDDDFILGSWPSDTLPKIILGDKIYIGVIDGNVEQVEFETAGVLSQAQDLDALTAKFGKPSTLERTDCGIDARWQLGQVSIRYRSCDGRAERGNVDARTQKMTDHAHQKREKDEAAQKPRVAL